MTPYLPLRKLKIANNYYKYVKRHPSQLVLGGLPKLNTKKTTVLLINSSGEIIDAYSYSDIECLKNESVTLISNEINDTKKREWHVLIK